MQRFSVGDQVRVDIPNQSDTDYERFHGEHGTVVSVITDDVGELTGNEQDSHVYRVNLESSETMDFRRHDLRPPIE